MMRYLLCCSLLCAQAARALTPVPDANLRAWITANYPGAMVGNAVNENHPGVQAATSLYMAYSGIASLQGVQAFANALALIADGNPITLAGVYTPPDLQSLSLADCQLSGTLHMDGFVPYTLQSLNVSGNLITSVVWCSSCQLYSFNASNNAIQSLTGTPPTMLNTLVLGQNQVTSGLSGLQLQYLDISYNQLQALPFINFLPGGQLVAHHNSITTLMPGDLSSSVTVVDLGYNQITAVGDLSGMTQLTIGNNPLTGGIDELPAGLLSLSITNTQLPCLPWLPQTLQTLTCTGNSFTCLPNLPPGLNLSPANYGFTPALCPTSNACYIPPPSVRLFAGLQGAWNETTGLMRDDLRAQGLLPLTQPYTAQGYSYVFNNTPLSVPAAFFTATGPTAIVDWVVVEVRQGGMPGTLVQSMPALVRRDGRVISTTGDTLLTLRVARGSYKVAVRHRNHLAVINFVSQPFQNGPTTIDLLNPGTTQLNMVAVAVTPSGKRLLPMGDVTGDKTVKYTGTGNDRDPILTTVGSTTPNNAVTSYSTRDVNMDGQVKYTGTNNDRDPILQAIGGVLPSATRTQVPVF